MAFAFKTNYPQIARESGFRFRQLKDGPLDWRLVGSMEVDRILRDQQFEQIDSILLHLSEVPLASMLDSNVLDSGVSKYFTLSQLALQYMIFCRKFLDESVRTLRENIIKLETQNIHLKTVNQEHTDNILHLHKKLIQLESINEVVFPCHVCTKNFVSNDALNVHLSKKHLKNPSMDSQGKEKDQTLINTIKLELEIKQLKERLNIAEKDIRQTSAIKKVSPMQIIKLNAGTQIDIQTRNIGTQMNFDNTKKEAFLPSQDIGTQCNLFESKEFDCTEDVQNHMIIFEGMRESDNEVKFAELKGADILLKIQDKISKLEALQQTHSNGNQQSINEIKQKLGEITEFLETQTKNNAENATKDAILSRISSHQNLSSTSVDELHRILSNMFCEVSQINFESINQIITKIANNYQQKLSALEMQNENKLQPHHMMQALESQFSMNINSIKKIDEPIKNKISYSHQSQTTNSIEGTSKCTSSDARSDICCSTNTSLDESHHSFHKRKERALDNSNVFKKFKNKLSLYGLNINSKRITATEAANISGHLLKQQEVFGELYPTFYKTRSRISKYVEYLISEKKDELAIKIDENTASKKYIEKILKSPIKKPISYVLRHNDDEIKPVPMPRKHVMFHTENDKNTAVESSLSKKK